MAAGNVIRIGLAMALGLAACRLAHAQEAAADSAAEPRDEELETDRDSFTPASSTAGPGRAIVEASYSFIDNRTGLDAHSFPELLVRRGLADWAELRLGWNYEAGGPGTVSGGEVGGEDIAPEQEARVLYGAKIRTSRRSAWLPESALIVQGYTPTAGPSNQSTVSVGEVFGWTFSNGWKWDSAMRFATSFENRDYFNLWAPSTVLKIPIGERWNAHAEYFGLATDGKAENLSQHYASFGGHVMLTPDFELGLRFGFGLTHDAANFFNNFGVGWRF